MLELKRGRKHTKARVISLTSAVVVISILAACSSSKAPSPPSISEGKVAVQDKSTEELWQKTWDGLVKAAEKEKKVVVVGAPAAGVRAALVQSFNAKYNIDLEYISVSGPEAAQQIQTQRRAGLYILDVLLGASAPGQTILKPAGAFDPLEPALALPEVTNKSNWWQGDLTWVDADHHRIAFSIYVSDPLAINTQMVKPEEIKSWKDLLNPKWKGKITIVDPTKNTSGNVTIVALAWKLMGMDYVRELARQELVISSDRRVPVEWVARGKYPIVIAPYSEAVMEFVQAGAPLMELIPPEGSHLTGGSGYVSLMNRAPHPNAAKVFINWLLSKEVQTIYSKQMGVQSAREDVPTEHLNPIVIRHTGVPYFATWKEEFLLTSSERLKLGQELFAPYMK